MSPSDFKQSIANRLWNQLLIKSGTPYSIGQSIARMGAIQAQDLAMAKWAIGIRSSHSLSEVEQAFNKGELLRTHLLRPTWHIVYRDDIRWMIRLTGPKILSSMRSRHKQLEITPSFLHKTNSILEKALQEHPQLSRDQINNLFLKKGIVLNDNRAAHILMCAELSELICSGESIDNETTYALFDKRVSNSLILSHEEALARLAEIYFTTRGPATLADFSWWSGLSSKQAKQGLQSIQDQLGKYSFNDWEYWFIPSKTKDYSITLLLPAYDEFILSYKDRSQLLNPTQSKTVISENGLFRPVILSGGKVIGIWKRAIKKGNVVIELHLFTRTTPKQRIDLIQAAEDYAQFLNQTADIVFA